MKYFYGVLCLLGVILPLGVFSPWMLENGLNLTLLVTEISNSRVGAFAWLDVIVSAVVLLGFIFFEGKRLGMAKLWLPVLGTCCIGVSLGLPLFLLMRELHLQNNKI